MSSSETGSDFVQDEFELPAPFSGTSVLTWPDLSHKEDFIVEEVPISLVYNGISHVVMMATPRDLEEFAIGFSLSEKIIPDISHIYDISVKPGCAGGIVVDIELSPRTFFELKKHRRAMVGRTGCGICGVESLEAVEMHPQRLPRTTRFDMTRYAACHNCFPEIQNTGALTGGTHAVLAFAEDGSFLGGAEDVGRHVAMDKVLGMRAKKGWDRTVLFLSSRASYEMVQKAAVCGVEIIFAISAPTNRALNLAREVDMTLAGFCRPHRANIYCGAERLIFESKKAQQSPTS